MGRFLTPVHQYFISYACLLLLALIPILTQSQTELFLSINAKHQPFLDKFFYIITYAGDGLVFVLFIIYLFFVSYSRALTGLSVFLGTTIIAQFLKRVIFADQLRPVGLLGKQFDLYIPDGVIPVIYNSFPSGHTTTVFAMATFLLLIIPRKGYWPLLLLLSLLVGYSRIYLTHHFPIDVWAGSLIGVGGAYLIFWWLDSIFEEKFGNRSILHK